jgi:hypothetical protein
MIRTNEKNLVELSVQGTIVHPRVQLKNPYIVDSTGQAHVLPGTGGITYNISVGDTALEIVGDHVEPGASISLGENDRDRLALGGLNILSCIGNEARVVSGLAAGAKGTVTGKHGGVEHILVDFPPAILTKLAIGDRVQIRAVGQGLKLKSFPDIQVMNVDPRLLQKMAGLHGNGQLLVPVTHMIPASIMGSGVGSRHSFSGDYDIQITDSEVVQKYGIQSLRLGDIIAIGDADCRFGRSVRLGAMSIGVVVHASCITSGHGPGVTVVMTTAKKLIVPKIEPDANIGRLLLIGRHRRRTVSRRRRGR